MAQKTSDPDERIYLETAVADLCFAIGRKEVALRIVDEIGDSLTILHPYVHSGEGHYAMTAISIYARGGEMEKAARLAKQWERTAYEPVALMKMAEGYIFFEKPKSALSFLSAARKACKTLRSEPDTQPSFQTWQEIVNLYAQAGAYAEALRTIREMNTSSRFASWMLADLALAFSETGRELNKAEKAELRQIISQYCD